MDSLYDDKREKMVQVLKDYLSSEYFSKYGIKKDFGSLKAIMPKLPKQMNMVDCGLYVLEYVENFYEVRIF